MARRGFHGGPGCAVPRVQPARSDALGKDRGGGHGRAGREFSFTTVNDGAGREETRWRYTMEPTPSGGTLLTESFEFLWCSMVNRLAEAAIPRGRQMDRGIQETLRRIKKAAETAA
ncbi:hypothetical protein BZL30_2146 [Mycobacterium kansasii]|uniref:Polyketide cyclase / dehydrase and lipid transport family protein n=1 Tax=Mycobacterium kansasii TaxID=1768 RepID=A0A1V3XH14_MYCKA|nr:hypothetical protein BZL30_2146 [Mycobacterium kansasii]